MPRRTIQLPVFLAVLLAGSVLAFAETPLPARSDRAIYDLAQLLDEASKTHLEAQSLELYDKSGVALIVVTVPKLVDETIDGFALRIGESWGVGKEGEDRGLVVALARAERSIYVATGYGTEGYLPDGKIGRLLDELAVPLLRKDRYGEGLVALVDALAAESAREYGVELSGGPSQQAPVSDWSKILRIVGAAIVFGYLAWKHPRLLLFLFLIGRGGRHGGGLGGFGGFGGGGFGGGGGGRDF
jgi:uncharacterized protein